MDPELIDAPLADAEDAYEKAEKLFWNWCVGLARIGFVCSVVIFFLFGNRSDARILGLPISYFAISFPVFFIAFASGIIEFFNLYPLEMVSEESGLEYAKKKMNCGPIRIVLWLIFGGWVLFIMAGIGAAIISIPLTFFLASFDSTSDVVYAIFLFIQDALIFFYWASKGFNRKLPVLQNYITYLEIVGEEED